MEERKFMKKQTARWIHVFTVDISLCACIPAQAGNKHTLHSTEADRGSAKERGELQKMKVQPLLTTAKLDKPWSSLAENIKNYLKYFDALQSALQAEWKWQFGTGESEIPWNGSAKFSSCPAPIGFWLQDHIFMAEYTHQGTTNGMAWIGRTYKFDIKRFIPKNAQFSDNQIKGKKEVYRAFVKAFFNQQTLPGCANYLIQNFLTPAADLLVQASQAILKTYPLSGEWADKDNLQSVFKLYAAYRQFDMSRVANGCIEGEGSLATQMNPLPNFEAVRKAMWDVVSFVYLQVNHLPNDTRTWLFNLLENVYQNPFTTENLRTYQLTNIKDLTLRIKRVEPMYASKHNLSLEMQAIFSGTRPEVPLEKVMEQRGYQQVQCSLFDRPVWVQKGSKYAAFIDWWDKAFP